GAITGTYAGALSGWYSDSKISRAVTCVGMAVSCTPPYFLALIFLSVFVFRLGIFPFKALYDEPTIASVIHHLALPVIVMTLFSASRNFLIMRGSVIQEKNSHYALYARAKGLFDRGILWKHILKNASLPLITQVALDFGFIFSGAIFIEIVFSLNGMGTLIYDAILGRDYPVLQGAFLVIAITVILANLLADILYGIIDPRVRVNER
ncbi:MAG: ABC transporter permease, partial [Methanogenium sp.]|nr:ABC transporter permease [Methanogenium sp.]